MNIDIYLYWSTHQQNSQTLVFTDVKETLHTLIKVIFAPVFICPFYTCKQLCYILYLPGQCCARREIIWDIWTCPALNLPAKGTEIKQRQIFPCFKFAVLLFQAPSLNRTLPALTNNAKTVESLSATHPPKPSSQGKRPLPQAVKPGQYYVNPQEQSIHQDAVRLIQ